MISLVDLKKLIKEQINENIEDTWEKYEKHRRPQLDWGLHAMATEDPTGEIGNLYMVLNAIAPQDRTPEEKETFKQLRQKYFGDVGEEAEETVESPPLPEEEIEAEIDPLAATQPMAHLSKTQIINPLKRGDLAATQPMGRSVPPLASVSGGDLEGQLPERPRRSSSLRRENKITKSHLQQIIKEELLVVLTDDEAMEMFGINPAKENNLLKLRIKK